MRKSWMLLLVVPALTMTAQTAKPLDGTSWVVWDAQWKQEIVKNCLYSMRDGVRLVEKLVAPSQRNAYLILYNRVNSITIARLVNDVDDIYKDPANRTIVIPKAVYLVMVHTVGAIERQEYDEAIKLWRERSGQGDYY